MWESVEWPIFSDFFGIVDKFDKTYKMKELTLASELQVEEALLYFWP